MLVYVMLLHLWDKAEQEEFSNEGDSSNWQLSVPLSEAKAWLKHDTDWGKLPMGSDVGLFCLN